MRDSITVMTDKEKVMGRHPRACAERDTPDIWTISNMPPKEWDSDARKYFPVRPVLLLLGMGRTELEAWQNAVFSIERREGVTL